VITLLVTPPQEPPQESQLFVDGTVFHTILTKIIDEVGNTFFHCCPV